MNFDLKSFLFKALQFLLQEGLIVLSSNQKSLLTKGEHDKLISELVDAYNIELGVRPSFIEKFIDENESYKKSEDLPSYFMDLKKEAAALKIDLEENEKKLKDLKDQND